MMGMGWKKTIASTLLAIALLLSSGAPPPAQAAQESVSANRVSASRVKAARGSRCVACLVMSLPLENVWAAYLGKMRLPSGPCSKKGTLTASQRCPSGSSK